MATEHSLKYPERNTKPLTVRWMFRFLSKIRRGKLEVALPDGRQFVFGGHETGPWGRWVIRDIGTLYRILLRDDLGFAEGYIKGEWDTPRLLDLLLVLDMNRDVLGSSLAIGKLGRVVDRMQHRLRGNSRRGSRENISAHYDLGNSFYREWLDETMTYSAAMFSDESQSLEDAQRAKYDHLLDRLQLDTTSHLLEIGSGWGALAIRAAQRFGCRVTSITLSQEQLAEATRRAAMAGVSERVTFRLQDYRDVVGRFDAVASIEMFEAVGEKYWPQFFRALARCLKPTGRAGLQVITINDNDFPRYRRNVDFIQRYIFPGGMLPSPRIFEEHARHGGFELCDQLFFGGDYAETLRRWDRNVYAKRDALLAQGYDETFLRTWHYYLAYCETGFRNHRTDVMQVMLQRSA